MPRKLPERFVPCDDLPCKECNASRKVCRYCDNCYEHCKCLICDLCNGYQPECAQGSDITRLLDSCNCERCAKCGKLDDRDKQNYLPDRYEPYCDKCFELVDTGE